jgi:hypothetical protein
VRDHLLARNREGGVRGHRLELVSLDSWNDPDTARRRAAELIADPLVLVAIVGDADARHDLDSADLPTVAVSAPADAATAVARALAGVDAAAATGTPTRLTVRFP